MFLGQEGGFALHIVNRGDDEQLSSGRQCVNRQRPFGESEWQAKNAFRVGVGSMLRPRNAVPAYGQRVQIKEPMPDDQ